MADVKKKLVDDLEELLGSNSTATPNRINTRENIDELSAMEIPRVRTDFHALKKTSTDLAKKVVNSLVKFYLDADVISKNEYHEYRKQIDEKVIAGFMFQMDMAEYACIKTLELIDSGELHFKNIEAYAKLAESLSNITRYNIDYLAMVESSWKKIRIENAEMSLLRGESKDDDSGNLKARGTKSLMEAAQNVAKEINLQQPNMNITIDARNTKLPDNIKSDEDVIDIKLKDELDSQF